MSGINLNYAVNNTAALHGTGVSSVSSSAQTNSFSNTMNSRLQAPSNLNSIFEDASRQYHVPVSLLKAVAKAESDFNPKAVSGAGAQGVMQLMPATARELGVSDSFNPRENIMGGAKYLSQMLQKYDGNTKLALAAYNAGSNNVDKYGGVPPFKETQNYVVKVMQYAGGDINAVVPSSYSTGGSGSLSSSYAAQDQTAFYQNILQNILDFDNFSTDDYLLFLELIKCNLKASSTDMSFDNSDTYPDSSLYSSRIQNLF